MGKRNPFSSIEESFKGFVACSFIINDTHVNVYVIKSKRAILWQVICIQIIWINRSVRFNALRSGYSWVEVVFSLQSLMAFNCLFKLKLNLRKVWTKLQGNFVNKFWCEGKVRPSWQVLVSLMLKFKLPSLIKLAHLLSNVLRCRFISKVFAHQLLQVVSHKSKGFWNRSGWSLTDELVSELILNAWLLSKNGFRLDIENPVVTLV